MITCDRTARNLLHFTLGAAIFLSAVTASASPDYCSMAPWIGLHETLRGEGLLAGEPDCFRLLTPAAASG